MLWGAEGELQSVPLSCLCRGVVALGTFVQGKQEARQVALDLDFSALLQGLQSSKALAAAASEVSTLLG